MKYTQGFVSCLSQRFSSAVAKRTWLWLSRSHPVLIIFVFVVVINCRCFCCCQADDRHWLCTNNAGSQPLSIIFVFLVAVVKLTYLVLIHNLLQYCPPQVIPAALAEYKATVGKDCQVKRPLDLIRLPIFMRFPDQSHRLSIFMPVSRSRWTLRTGWGPTKLVVSRFLHRRERLRYKHMYMTVINKTTY